MKKLSLLLFFTILLLAGAISCSSDYIDNIAGESVSLSYSAFDDAKLRILSMGLDTTDIIDTGEYYIVEEDILINKDSLNKYQATRQYHATYTVATGQTITICVNSQDLLNSWGTEISKVADIYTEYTGNVFKFIGCDTDADIVISKEALSYSLVCAEGEFPVNNSGKPGKHVRINSVFFRDIDTFLTSEEKIFLMMHEIGHNLGLRHTDCAVNGEGDASIGMVKIPGTPDTDSNSYMNSGTCGYSWTGMPEYDAVALKYLFPKYYTVHFMNCNCEDVFYIEDKYYVLDRTIIPVSKSGYVFAGWYYDAELTAPYYYTRLLNQNIILYPKWVLCGEEVVVSSSTSPHTTPYTFYTDKVITITMEGRVYRGRYEWTDFTDMDYYCSMIARTDNTFAFYWRMPFKDYVLNTSSYTNSNYVVCKKRLVLEPGRYNIISQFPRSSEEQEGASGMHGKTETIITYYK